MAVMLGWLNSLENVARLMLNWRGDAVNALPEHSSKASNDRRIRLSSDIELTYLLVPVIRV